MMYTIKNDKLEIAIKKTGAELCKITALKHGTDFMWEGHPDVWSGCAPNLFPIVGALKDSTYVFDGATYTLPKHGFLRRYEAIELHKQTEHSLVFKLAYNTDLLKIYPFKFEFFVTYTLVNNTIEVLYTVKNVDDKALYFSVGGHPAFKCPVFENEPYNAYTLEFEQEENSKRHLINLESGLITPHTETVFKNTNSIALTHNLFNKDALVFKDLKSKKVTLNSKTHGRILSVAYHDFEYLGIWAKPNGDYVCIEPWLGIADSENTNQDFITKEGIIKLDAGNTYKAGYTIEIDNKHLT